MKKFRMGLGALIGFCLAATARGQQPVPPPELLPNPPARVDLSDHAVLLPPQMLDDTAKTANNTRESSGEWSISAGIYLLQPVFQTNPAFVVSGAGGNISRQVDFSHNLDVAPQVWLGYVGEHGWGLRGRWFDFDHGSSASYATAPGETVRGISPLTLGQTAVNGTLSASSNLALNVLDFQASYSCYSGKWSLLSACGIRYTHLSQDYQTSLSGTAPVVGATHIDLTSGHNLNGAGPSFSFEAKRRIGETGFSVYGNLHTAILFGTANEEFTANNNGTPQEYTNSHTSVLPVGEMELGAEYCRSMGRAKLFVQGGFVGQVWFGGGNASNLDPIGSTSAASHNFGLIGLSLRAGVRY